MKQKYDSKLPKKKEQQLWNHLNEIVFTQLELDALDKAFDQIQINLSAYFVRIEAIEDIRGKQQADTTFDKQIEQILSEINSDLEKLEKIQGLVKHRWEFINKCTERLKNFVMDLPPKDHLVIEASKRLKSTNLYLKQYAKKIDHQDQTITNFLQDAQKHRSDPFPGNAGEDSHHQGKLQIFLCHSSRDKPLVRKLYDDLRKAGFKPWLDEIDLLPGQDWEREIRLAIEEANFFLACLSQNAVDAKGYVHKEIKIALDILDRVPEGRIYLIPVRFENCKVPDRLSSRQWVDLFTNNGFERLTKALRAR